MVVVDPESAFNGSSDWRIPPVVSLAGLMVMFLLFTSLLATVMSKAARAQRVGGSFIRAVAAESDLPSGREDRHWNDDLN